MSTRILHGDCREVLKTLADNSVDSIVVDPPYHLTTGKKGGTGAASVKLDSPAGRARIGTGFMGMTWDGGDVAFQPATWAEAMRVLKPGGFLVAFGGTRTFHRLVCAIEDGGFDVRDMLAWLYGSGFPKGTDKAKIPEAWRGWNTALKPAIEPICLARKAMDGTLAHNLEKWGTGALWIDGCRVALDGEEITATGKGAIPARHDEYSPRDAAPIEPRPAELGRWPANVLHDGSDEVLAEFPKAPGQIADAKTSGERKTANVYGVMRYGEPSADSDNAGVVGFKMKPGARRSDEGSAARFFYCAKADRGDRNEGLDGAQAKQQDPSREAGRPGGENPRNRGAAERANHHPTVKPTDLMRWLVRLVTPPRGLVLDFFAGSGSTLKAADLEGFDSIGIEREAEYVEIARRRVASDMPLFADVTTEVC